MKSAAMTSRNKREGHYGGMCGKGIHFRTRNQMMMLNQYVAMRKLVNRDLLTTFGKNQVNQLIMKMRKRMRHAKSQ